MQQNIIKWKRNIFLFLSGQGVTLFGSMMVHYAIQWHIVLETQSGITMTLISISMALPMFLVSPFAGVWADRYSKKLLINLADGTISVITLIMAVFFSLGYEYIALLLVCIAFRGAGQGVQMPAVNSLLPEIVPQEHLMRINGINSTMQSIISFASPVAGAALIYALPIQGILFIDVITATIGMSILIFFVKTPKKQKKDGEQSAWREMAEGLRYIKTHAFVRKLIMVCVLYNLIIAPAALLSPLQTIRNFGEEPWRLAAIELVFFIGMALGGALISLWGGFKNKSYTIAFGTSLGGIFVIGLGLSDFFTMYLACMGLCGITVPLFNAPLMTLLQIKVEAEFMGRVFSVLTMLSSIMMPIGMAAWGPLADAVSIDLLMIISGVGILATGGLFILSRTLRESGQPQLLTEEEK